MQAIAVQTLNTNTPTTEGMDPMVTRWGVNCSTRDKFVAGSCAGFTQLPFGKFFPISRFTTPEEIHSVDVMMAKEQLKTKTAQSVETYLNSVIGGRDDNGNPDVNKLDLGFRTGFYGELDAPKMAVISATLIPTLSEIRALTGKGICKGQDNFDFSDRESCPSCWLEWVESTDCTNYIAKVAQEGRKVDEFSPAGALVAQRTVKPTVDELETARKIVTTSLKVGIAALKKIWVELSTDLEKGDTKDLTTYQHGIRKDLHESKPVDKQVMMIEKFAQASGGGNNNEILGVLAQQNTNMQAIMAMMAQQMGFTMPGAVTPPATPAPAPAVAAAPEPVHNDAETISDDELDSIINPAANPSLSPAAQKMAAKAKEKK